MNSLRLPDFYRPLEVDVHPDAEQIEHETEAWINEFGLCADHQRRQHLVDAQCGRCGALMAPHAPYSLSLVDGLMTAWAFAFDDEWCDEPPTPLTIRIIADAFVAMERAMSAPDKSVPSGDRYAVALRDLRLRIESDLPTAVDRFAAHMRAYLLYEFRKAAWVAAGHRPTLDQYADARLYVGGPLLFSYLSPEFAGAPCPRSDGPHRAIAEMGAILAAWNNDAFSYTKESTNDQDGHNIIDTLADHYRVKTPIAMDKAADVFGHLMTRYTHLGDQLLHSGDTPTRRFVTENRYFVAGAMEFSAISARYGVPGGFTTTWNPAWPRPSIPAIEWWWTTGPIP
jgi:hypothetical protein